MPIPVLKLNLVPPPTLWRRHHETIGWTALAVGTLVFLLTGVFTWRLYAQAATEGKKAAQVSGEARRLAHEQSSLVRDLQAIDVPKELPRWRLAERYFSERTLRWSRLTAELERSLTRDVRLKSIQKVRGSDQQVQLKVRGESRGREAEVTFIESLYQNQKFFPQIILERESERQGGGVDFDLTLAVNPVPEPYEKLIIPPPVYRDQNGAVLPANHPEVVKWLAAGGAKSVPKLPPRAPAAGPAAPPKPVAAQAPGKPEPAATAPSELRRIPPRGRPTGQAEGPGSASTAPEGPDTLRRRPMRPPHRSQETPGAAPTGPREVR